MKKKEEANPDELCKNILDVNWDIFFKLRDLSEKDISIKEKYETALKNLVSLGILSFDGENNYSIKIYKNSKEEYINPVLENKVLYFAKIKDAIKVHQCFENSSLYIINN